MSEIADAMDKFTLDERQEDGQDHVQGGEAVAPDANNQQTHDAEANQDRCTMETPGRSWCCGTLGQHHDCMMGAVLPLYGDQWSIPKSYAI